MRAWLEARAGREAAPPPRLGRRRAEGEGRPVDQVPETQYDFKKGVEFKTYATHKLPHARAVAVESDREFGLSVLQGLAPGALTSEVDPARDAERRVDGQRQRVRKKQ